MADNVVTSAAIGTGITLATDDIASVHYQRVKLSLGADGTANDANVGAGAVATGTLRVTLASDDPAVVALQILDNAISGSEMQVDVITCALPTGASTAANQTTIIGHLDGVEGLLTTIDADTSTLAGAVSGTEMQVDVVAALPAGTNLIGRIKPEGDEYETVAASQTAQVLGATGAAGDYIAGVLVIPATTSPGNVILLDNATSITIFTGGASSVSNLVPFLIPLGMTSVSGAWKITTGANVSCIGIGNFT